MQKPATFAEKILGAFLIAIAIFGLYLGLMALIDGHISAAGKFSNHRPPVYFSKSPVEFILRTGFWLVAAVLFAKTGWAALNSKDHTQTVNTRTLPLWFKIGAQVRHPTYGRGAIIRINGLKYVTIVFEHYSQKTLAIEVVLTLLKPLPMETEKPPL